MFSLRAIKAAINTPVRKYTLRSTGYTLKFHTTTNSSDGFAVISAYCLHKNKVQHNVQEIRKLLDDVGATGRMYFNSQGFNCQMCINNEKFDDFKDILNKCFHSQPETVKIKVHYADFNVFRKLRVRQGKLLEKLEETNDISVRGKHLDRDKWNKILDEEEDILLLDIRNSYEWDVGRFKGAKRPTFKHFKHFDKIADEVVKDVGDSSKKVLMYCTGGIRCEVFSSMLIKRGVKNVYQLKDGVLGYGEGAIEETRHWEGNLFVFDDRLVVPIDGVVGGEKDNPVSTCSHCNKPASMVYNCNSLQCNVVHVSCMECAVKMRGCCSEDCKDNVSHHFLIRNSRQWPKGVEGGKMIGRGELYREWVSHMS